MTFSLQTVAESLETQIRAHRLMSIDVPWADEIIFPNFEGLALPNITHEILRQLNVPTSTPTPLDKAVWGGHDPYGTIDRVVLVISDGLGYRWLKQMMAEDAAVADMVGDLTDGRGAVPLTSIAPSTTAVALPTYWTGVTPSQHGMLGTKLWLREVSMMVDMLHYKPLIKDLSAGYLGQMGLPPATFIPQPTLGEMLSAANVETHLLLEKGMMNTGLSNIMHRGIQHKHIHRAFSDFKLRLHDVLRTTRGKRAYISVYHPGVDSLSHAYGAHNDYLRHEVRTQLQELRDILQQPDVQDGRTLVLIVADHGHHDVTHSLKLNEHAHLYEHMRATTGAESRFSYIYLSQAAKQEFIGKIQTEFSEHFAAIDGQAALTAGLFGPYPAYSEVHHRVGDVILLARLGWVAEDHLRENTSFSRHGGLSDWEMLIPFMWKRI